MLQLSGVVLLLTAALLVGTTSATNYPWRVTMTDTCWTNASCPRAMIVSHGGDWDPIVNPYDSMPAFKKAYNDGAEAVKGDFRVSSDNIGVIMHSSPVMWYESLDCDGKLVQNMTVAECTSCKMALTNYTFLSLPEMLSWSNGNVIVMLCVKRTEDIARAISSVIELNATDRVFLEIRIFDLMTHVIQAKPPGWDQVYYLAESGCAEEVHIVLNNTDYNPLLSRTFMLEFESGYNSWGLNVNETIAGLHALNVKTFTCTTEILPSVESQVDLFLSGIDVVYTYDTQNAVLAREQVNTMRGISPP